VSIDAFQSQGLVVCTRRYLGWLKSDGTWDIADPDPTKPEQAWDYWTSVYGVSSFTEQFERREALSALIREGESTMVRELKALVRENILKVDPVGDPYNPDPHVFCSFDGENGPYGQWVDYVTTSLGGMAEVSLAAENRWPLFEEKQRSQRPTEAPEVHKEDAWAQVPRQRHRLRLPGKRRHLAGGNHARGRPPHKAQAEGPDLRRGGRPAPQALRRARSASAPGTEGHPGRVRPDLACPAPHQGRPELHPRALRRAAPPAHPAPTRRAQAPPAHPAPRRAALRDAAGFVLRAARGQRPPPPRATLAADRRERPRRAQRLLKSARRQRPPLVEENVCERVEPPAPRKYRARTLSVDELRTLLLAIATHQHGPLWTFIADTGCRFGEAAGQTWRAVNLEQGVAAIAQAAVRVKTADGWRLSLQETQSEAGHRLAALSRIGVAALTAQRARVAAMRLAAGADWQDLDLVFATRRGTPLRETHVNRAWHRMLKANGLPRLRMHDLRHTKCTLMVDELSEELMIVHRTLGHTSPAITAGIYVGKVPKALRRAADRFGALLELEPAARREQS
jgi:integrase